MHSSQFDVGTRFEVAHRSLWSAGSGTTEDYSENLEARLEQVQEFAKITSNRMKERYNSSVDDTLLEREDPVWLFNPQRKKGKTLKLTRPWQGPYCGFVYANLFSCI